MKVYFNEQFFKIILISFSWLDIIKNFHIKIHNTLIGESTHPLSFHNSRQTNQTILNFTKTMNLLANDKYRTKIMEHLLHQYENESPTISERNQLFNQVQFKHDEHEKDFCRSKFFQKVSKQKALICDGQNTQRETNKHFIHKKSVDMIRLKQNFNQNAMSSTKEKQYFQLSTPKGENKMPQVELKGHLKKQSFIYHQKLPVMSISKPQDCQILRKLTKNVKLKSNENKQNSYKESNHVQTSSSKEKKYRFVVATKVAEALKSRRQTEKADENKNQHVINPPTGRQITKEAIDENRSFNETHRSKGSKQMIEFMESARQQLFQNMKKDTPQTLVLIRQQEKELKTNTQEKQQNPMSSEEKFYHQTKKSFKIEIQVSANKTCQIQLTLNSNPKEIARNFIQQHQNQLSSFKDLQVKKLEELLSKKISLEVDKQKKILKSKCQKQVHDKFQNIINHVGVNQMLLKDSQSDKKSYKNKNQKVQQKIDKSKQKKLQFSHVYIEKIDIPVTNEENEFNQSQKLNSNLQVSPQIKKAISFDPTTHINHFKDQSIQEVKLQGYLSSPHQLITYRPEDSCQNSSSYSQSQNNEVNSNAQQEELFNHFPLSTSFVETHRKSEDPLSSKRTFEKDISNKSKSSLQSEIGAAKILSRSRQKLLKLKQQISVHRQLTQEQQESMYVPNKQQMKSENDLTSQRQEPQRTVNPTCPTINHISSQIVSRLGKENIMNSMREKQMSKREKILKQREQKDFQEMKECSFKPKINNLSKSIDKSKKIKIGDLIDNNSQNYSEQKVQNSINNQSFFKPSVNQRKEMNESSKFDKIMSKLQKPQDRCQQLYDHHQVIQAKKQFIRQKSLEKISFKPQMNKISKKIMQTKRNSLNNSACQQLYSLANSKVSLSRHSACKKPSKRNSMQYSNDYHFDPNDTQQMNKKRNSMNVTRNLQGLQIGDYLYKEAMKMQKKKQSQPQSKVENFKPLEKSQRIMSNLREKRLSEYFNELTMVEQQHDMESEREVVLTPTLINLDEERFFYAPLRYFIPLLEELKELDVTLTRDQFIESGMKLFAYLSQDEKADFMKRSSFNEQDKQNSQRHPSINKFSQQIVQNKQFYLQDIYHRGLHYKKQIKDKIETDIQNKVRKELERCTFKPKINYPFQNAP